jgi:hypothetical protein
MKHSRHLLLAAAVVVFSALNAMAQERCIRFHQPHVGMDIYGRGGVFPFSVPLEQIGCDVLGKWTLSGRGDVIELDSYDMQCRQVQIRLRQRQIFSEVKSGGRIAMDAVGLVMLDPTRTEYTGLLRGTSGPDVRVGFVKTQRDEYFMWHEQAPSGGCRNISIEAMRPL